MYINWKLNIKNNNRNYRHIDKIPLNTMTTLRRHTMPTLRGHTLPRFYWRQKYFYKKLLTSNILTMIELMDLYLQLRIKNIYIQTIKK